MEKIDIKLVDNVCGCTYCVFEEDCNRGNFEPMLEITDGVDILCKQKNIWIKPEDEEFICKARKYWARVGSSSSTEDKIVIGLVALFFVIMVAAAIYLN